MFVYGICTCTCFERGQGRVDAGLSDGGAPFPPTPKHEAATCFVNAIQRIFLSEARCGKEGFVLDRRWGEPTLMRVVPLFFESSLLVARQEEGFSGVTGT